MYLGSEVRNMEDGLLQSPVFYLSRQRSVPNLRTSTPHTHPGFPARHLQTRTCLCNTIAAASVNLFTFFSSRRAAISLL